MGAEPTTPTRPHAGIPPTPSSTPRSTHQLSPAPTPVESIPPPSPRTDKLAAAFAIHDYLVRKGPPDLDVPFPFFATIGGQSAAKSSMLSALLNVVLWSSPGTATHGPTLIHSCHRPLEGFKATIEIEIAAPHRDCPKRIAFASSPIESRKELEDAMRWAGDEARRAGRDGAIKIRSYETLKGMDDIQRQRGSDGWSKFTTNEVRLTISGPQQKDVSIVDLPGLHGNDETVYGLAEMYISKPECIVILCIPAGGKDPSNGEPEVALVQKHRPNGKGVMGIITKADRIESDSSDPYHKLIGGTSTDMGPFIPEHGWSPLRLRTSTERAKSDEEIHMIQARLFAQPHWTSLAKGTGKAFGIDATAQELARINEFAVLKNFNVIRTRLQDLKLKNKERLHELPAEVTDPVGTTHELICAIAERLEARFVRQAVGSDELYELQKDLLIKLDKVIPRFLPYFEQDVERAELYTDLSLPDAWRGEECGPDQHVDSVLDVVRKMSDQHVDSVLDVVRKYTTKRTGECDLNAVRRSFAGLCTEKLRETCLAHVDDVWGKVSEGVEDVVEDVCGRDKTELASLMRQVEVYRVMIERGAGSDRHRNVLSKAQQDLRRQIIDVANSLCNTESEDPKVIDISEGKVALSIESAFKHFTSEYEKIYRPRVEIPSTPLSARTSPADPQQPLRMSDGVPVPSTSVATATSSEGRRPSPPMTHQEEEIVFQVMAHVTVFLVCGATRLGNVVGRETQVRVVRYFRQTASALRKGLELDELQQARFQKIRKLHDPDPEVAREREELAKRQEQLDEFEATLGRV